MYCIYKLLNDIEKKKERILILTSLISPTSKFLLSTILPFESAGPSELGWPALTGVHGEVIVPGPTIPSVKEK